MPDHKITYFAIKVTSVHKDLILIKGNENECDPIIIEGSVKMSINQNIHVKKVKLTLTGQLSVNFFQQTPAGTVTSQIIEKYVTLRVLWDNLLIDDMGEIIVGSYGDKPIKQSKLSTATPQRPNFERSLSHSTLMNNNEKSSSIKIPTSGIDGTPFRDCNSSHSFLLPQGNYSLPFKIVLPTNTCESVEGLSIGRLLYKFEASIQKGFFDKPLTRTKYLRLVRTLHPNDLNLTQDVDITDTWPRKVDYKVYIPKKGIALGSNVPIRVLIIPLTKGLKLKRIMAEIVQHFHVDCLEAKSPEFEQVFGTQKVMGTLRDDENTSDKWDLTCYYKVPNNISEITQTCLLNHNLIQVRHRLRVSIQIKNAEGYSSELRANLPITVYISSNIGHVFGHKFEIDPQHGGFNIIKGKEDALFKRDKVFSVTNSPLVSPIGSSRQTPVMSPLVSPSLAPFSIDDNLEEDELDNSAAPPVYELAKNDKIYDMTSPKSPIEQLGTSYFDLPTTTRPNPIELDPNALTHLPSYNEAEEDDNETENEYELAPQYEHDLPYTLQKNHSMPFLGQDLNSQGTNSRSSSHSALVLRKKAPLTEQ